MMIPRRTITEKADLQRLSSRFPSVFSGLSAQFAVAAPGRVNLIGEHVDYCGYSVFPMALNRTVRMAVHVDREADGLRLANVDDQYKPFESPNMAVAIDRSRIEWHHYFVCGFRTVEEFAKSAGRTLPRMRLSVLVEGDVPPNAGLSSSSALVVAAAIAVSHAAGLNIPRRQLAELCAKGEHHIGTQGGGMDQACALLAEEGRALLINFKQPIEALPRLLPSDVRFVIANSQVTMNKAASSQFNQRVVECRVAAKLLVKLHGKTAANIDADWRDVTTLAEAQEALKMADPQTVLDLVYSTLIHESELGPGDGPEIRHDLWHDYEDSRGTWTREQVVAALECSDAEFADNCLTADTRDMTTFHVGSRARHVFAEAERALHFAALCLSLEGNHPEVLDAEVPHEKVILEMGALMTKSHQSCTRFFQCSHPDLDRLVELGLNAGAVGSRLTGAGWGGCTVHMVPSRKVDAFVETLGAEFYTPRGMKANDAVIVVQPGACAAVYE